MIRSTKTAIAISAIFILVLLAVQPAQAFVASHIDYTIHSNGDALVTADYEMSLGEKIALMIPGVKDQFTGVIKSEYGEGCEVIEVTDSHAQFTIPDYGVVTNTYVQSPAISFVAIETRANGYWFMKYLDIDYSPTITTVRSDWGEIAIFDNAMTIPAVTFTF